MKYTITIQRMTGTNAFESLMVLVTENWEDYIDAMFNLREMFMRNRTYLNTSEHRDDNITRCFIEYDLSRGK